VWAAGLETDISPGGEIGFVGPYNPSPFSFGGFVRGMTPADMTGWDAPIPNAGASRVRPDVSRPSPQ
jgi:hypothetical protein